MKTIIYFILGCIAIPAFMSCEEDNYEPPNALLQGTLVYNGDPIHVEYSSEQTRSVYFELWEPGWQTDLPIYVVIDQDGSYSALLFNGTYKLVFPGNQGPFLNVINEEVDMDTITVNVNGSKTLDIEVMPYYMVRNHAFSGSDNMVSSSFDLEQVVTGAEARAIERVALYIGKTQFVDSRTSISTTEMAGSDIISMNDINLNTEVPTMTPSQNYVFARVGVKISGVEDMIFTPVEKVQL